ncbi:glycoside hydrolase family 78 protein [Maribellus sp. CM-23]|uniref:glycoside hydrolase family 78 protein n=1 Tax=Maribellus sp. CM-23 TaxID=2781026 RepID=UPI001F191581|nr:glycoside hydrolase family 78 protein [Maribellus sp. CM-23]MCE4565400.1 glycoside hydrolase family 78 protein [Maribellus sp. CM-23]
MSLKSFIRRNFLILCLSCFSLLLVAKTTVVNKTCEYHVNPIGIDIVQPRLSWQLQSDGQNIMQSAYEIRVAASESALNSTGKLIWTSGKVISTKSVNVVYEGPALASMQRVYWKVRIWDQDGKASAWSQPAFWETGILQPSEWEAEWITLPNEPENKTSLPVHYYRKEFSASKKVKSARIYATSHGLYELFLNGEKVGDQLFTPGWTSYKNRLQYQTYDVTDRLGKSNAIGALLGDGWYRGYIGFSGQRSYYGDKTSLLVMLKIDYTDGSSEVISSNDSWKVTTGAILASDIYNGEMYDANLEMPGWKSSNFDDSLWKQAAVVALSKDMLVAQEGVPVRAVETLQPIKKMNTPAGELVYDMGQNMVGNIRISLKGNKGDKVVMQYAEVLDKDGNFYTANLRAAQCTDTYIFAGDGEVVYEPHFTFHGFRFVKISGVSKEPTLEDIKGVVIHSDMPATGTFECSNELINLLQHNIQWGQKGNFLDVPTDCPQRDERLGWTGDAQVFSMTAGYNFNVAGFYTKWMKDVESDQLEDGKVPHVIPDVLNKQGGATGWADAVAVIPWTVYKIYGDTRILEESYPAVTKWVGYMQSRAGDDYLWTGDNHFGDWLAFATTRSDYPGATTEKDLLATAYFYYTTTLTAKMAGILGKTEDQKKYGELAANIKEAFTKEFVTPNGRLVSHTQTAYVLALSFGLIPDERMENAAAYLAQDVSKFGHLTTGFLGTPLLCHTLSGIGRDDLAFMLLNRKKYPSWLYPVTQGATTIWERWDGQKPDGTFQDVGMNSFNHYAYGAIGEWLYSWVAGISIDEAHPGYKHFTLAPHPGGELTYVNASFESVHGRISSNWKLKEGTFVYDVEIPANTSAQVVLPNAGLEAVKAQLTDTVKEVKQIGDDVVVELGSGKYHFSYPLKK